MLRACERCQRGGYSYHDRLRQVVHSFLDENSVVTVNTNAFNE